MRIVPAMGLGLVLGLLASNCGPTVQSGSCDADGVCNATCAADVDCGGAGGGSTSPLCTGARLVEPGGDTLLDCTTAWVWQKTPHGSLLTWSNALQHCAGLTLAGQSDWQLPTRVQLESLLLGAPGTGGDYGGSGCRQSPLFRGQCTWFWSADEASATQAWGVDFQQGGPGPVTMNKTNVNGVRCVRNVPPLSGTGGGSAGGGSAGGGGGGSTGCTKDADCTSPKICRSSQCVYECTTDSDCSSLRRCTNNKCVTFSCGSCQRVSDHRCVDCGSGPYGCYC